MAKDTKTVGVDSRWQPLPDIIRFGLRTRLDLLAVMGSLPLARTACRVAWECAKESGNLLDNPRWAVDWEVGDKLVPLPELIRFGLDARVDIAARNGNLDEALAACEWAWSNAEPAVVTPDSPLWALDIGDQTEQAWNILESDNIRDIAGLCLCTEAELLAMDMLGPTIVEAIKAALARHGLALAQPRKGIY